MLEFGDGERLPIEVDMARKGKGVVLLESGGAVCVRPINFLFVEETFGPEGYLLEDDEYTCKAEACNSCKLPDGVESEFFLGVWLGGCGLYNCSGWTVVESTI